jgi:hypothetical protein
VPPVQKTRSNQEIKKRSVAAVDSLHLNPWRPLKQTTPKKDTEIRDPYDIILPEVCSFGTCKFSCLLGIQNTRQMQPIRNGIRKRMTNNFQPPPPFVLLNNNTVVALTKGLLLPVSAIYIHTDCCLLPFASPSKS